MGGPTSTNATYFSLIAAGGSPTPSVIDAPKLASVGVEKGFSGTVNYDGNPVAESNPKLLDTQAFGVPGSRRWGEWESLLRTDPDVSAGMEFTKQKLRDARVDVTAAAADAMPDREVAAAQAEFVRWCLLEKCEPGWPEIIQQMADALLYGFSLHELCWSNVTHASLPNGSGYAVTKLAQRLPMSVHQNGWLEEAGELKFIKQLGQKVDGSVRGLGGFGEVLLPTEKVSLFTWNRSGNNYRGFSAFRSVWYLCKQREQILKAVGISTIREGSGIPIAEIDKDAADLTPKQRRDLEQFMANLVVHENASAVMPKGVRMNWVSSSTANKQPMLEVWSAMGLAILRQVGAQQLALGTGNTGSRSVGEVHDGNADAFAQGVISAIEGVLNGMGSRPYTGLVRKLVDANWGPQQAYPRLTLTLKRAKISPIERAQAVAAAVTAKSLTITSDIENAMREELGFSPISEEELQGLRDEKSTQALDTSGAIQPGTTKEPKTVEQIKSLGRNSSGVFEPYRPLRFAEKRLDLSEQDRYLTDARVAFERLVRPAVVHALVEAMPAITAAMADGDASDVADVPLNTDKLMEIVRAFLNSAREEGGRQVRQETARGTGQAIANKRADGIAVAPVKLASGDEKDLTDSEAETEADDIIEAQTRALTRRIANRTAQELETEAINALRTGAAVSEVIQRTVLRQLETGAFKADAGLIITKAWNAGREEAASILGGVAAVQYSAILDASVCGPCASLDGQQWPFNSDEHIANIPPNRDCEGGDRCRCLLVYLTAEDSGVNE